MNKLEMNLPGGSCLILVERDAPAKLSENDRTVCRNYVAEALGKAIPGLKVSPLSETQYCRRDMVVAESVTHKAARYPVGFVQEFPMVLQDLVGDLAGKLKGLAGPHVMEMLFNDETSFSQENHWGDWLYVYARLAPVEKR